LQERLVKTPRIAEACQESDVADFRRWRLAPDFVTPTMSLHELPRPAKRAADSWIHKLGRGFDVDNNRSLLGNQQEIWHMLAHSPIDRCPQEKRLRDGTVHTKMRTLPLKMRTYKNLQLAPLT
jgi:hypothetical protein